MNKSETNIIIEYLQKGKLLTEELKDLLLRSEERGLTEYTLSEVNSLDELEVLNGFTIAGMFETEEEIKVKGTNIVFARKLSDGGYVHRDLLIYGNGMKYLSEEYE